jgi:hypothetical protein
MVGGGIGGLPRGCEERFEEFEDSFLYAYVSSPLSTHSDQFFYLRTCLLVLVVML